MTADKLTPSVNMSQRALMQYLSLTKWKAVYHLPVRAGPVMLNRIHGMGWIEQRGMKTRTEARLTPSGREALRAPV